MSTLREPRLPRCAVNCFGDVICPTCTAQLIMPASRVLRAGVGSCSICGSSFRVTGRAARRANEQAERFHARMTMEALRDAVCT